MPIGFARQSLNLANPVVSAPTLTFVAQAFQTATTSSTITIPATAAVGDIAILFDRQNNNSNTTLAVPSGWTLINTRSVNPPLRATVSYRILTAGQPGTTIAGQGLTARKIMVVYRPNAPITTATVLTNTTSGSPNTTAAAASLTQDLTAQTQRPILAFAFWCHSVASTFSRGSTLTAEREITDGGGFTWVRMFVFNPGSSTSTVNTISMGTSSASSIKFMLEGSLRLS
jgi:hypothetical protein